MARTARGRPPLWSLLVIVPGSFFLAPMVASWFGWLVQALAGPNSSLAWYYAIYIQPIRVAFLILLCFAGLKLWQYLSVRGAGGVENEGVPIFAARSAEKPPTACWFLLLASLTAGLLLRIIALGQSFTYDEIFTLQNFVHLPNLSKVVVTNSTLNNHILYSVLAWVVAMFLGEGEIALRLPAVLFGIAGVYAIFALGRELFGWREGLVSSFLLAFSLWHVYYSQGARGYSAAVFFSISSTFFLVKGMTRNSVRIWLVYILCVVFGLYSNLAFGFLLVAHLGFVAHSGIGLGYRKQRLRGLKGFAAAWLTAVVVSLILYAPVLKDVATNILSLMGTELVGFENLMIAYLSAIGDIVAWVSGDRYAISQLAVLALATVGLARLGRKGEPEGTKRLFSWIIALGLAAILLLVVRRFFYSRFFVVTLPFFVLAIASGIVSGVSRVRPSLRAGATVGVVLVLLVPQLHGLWIYYQNSEQDVRGAAQYLKVEATREDMVVVVGIGWQEFSYYYDRPVHHPASVRELSGLAAREQPSYVYFVMLFGPEEKGPLAKWARSRATEVKFFPPAKTGLPLVTIEVLKARAPLVISP